MTLGEYSRVVAFILIDVALDMAIAFSIFAVALRAAIDGPVVLVAVLGFAALMSLLRKFLSYLD